MKKLEWLVAIFIIVMGVMCLVLSAASFRGMSFPDTGRLMGNYCLWLVPPSLLIALIYCLIKLWRKR
ncbi:hypothetical protein [Paenibacillus caui]|uniref:hypothetical protein n=1 Tax=Paenibacillus caui TaxID=2873927 RepID=UPI001CA86AA6|nr:hypothetical protein [Paenibacillus caui]